MRKNIRAIISIFIILLFISQPIGDFNLPLLTKIEKFTYDARLKYTAPYTVDKNIVILDIDEKSLSQLGQWPWNRSTVAGIVDNLFDYYQINNLGFDILFAEKDDNQTLNVLQQLSKGSLKNDAAFQSQFKKLAPQLDHDLIFANSLKGSETARRKTILAFAMLQEPANTTTALPNPVLKLDDEISAKISLIKQPYFIGNLPLLQDNAYSAGFIDNPSIAYDTDGVFRRVPLLQMHDGKIYESLAFGLFRSAIGSPSIQIHIKAADADEILIDRISVGDYEIPVDNETNILVPYRGYIKSFPYISAVDVLNKTAPIEALKDAIVIMGTSAAGLKDLRTTPLETGFPGVEVHANIISGIIENRIKEEPNNYGLELLLLLVLGIFLSLAFPRLSPLYTTLTTFATIFVLIAGNLFAWQELNLVLPLTNPLLLVVSIFGLHMSYGFFIEAHSKRQITRLFGQYVPPELVDELSEHPEELSLDGETREMSVLFSDVRSFTTISESLEPKELTQFINGFLTPMTEVIHQHRGTIDKYMGDAIMAFWGAPLTDEQHARHSLEAGMMMIEKMEQLSADFRKRGWPEIKIGVGINSGPMNVGNMGSEFRMAYTVLGDTVNLGSRLEGLTKNYGVNIIVSEYTREQVPDYEYRFLDKVRVKGKDQPVTIYEPLGLREELSEETRTELTDFHLAMDSFHQQQWNQARELLEALQKQFPQRYLYTLYLERLAFYLQHSPEANWDGVFTHTSK